jgi:Na+/melibiose symporter-like transporter
MSFIATQDGKTKMEKFKSYVATVGAALVAVLVAPFVAVFGLTMLGLAFGMSILMTVAMIAIAWRNQPTARPDQTAAQPAAPQADGTDAQAV